MPFAVTSRPLPLKVLPLSELDLSRLNTNYLGLANSTLSEAQAHLDAAAGEESAAFGAFGQSDQVSQAMDPSLAKAASVAPAVVQQTTTQQATAIVQSAPVRTKILNKFSYTVGVSNQNMYYLTDEGVKETPPPVVPIPPSVMGDTQVSGSLTTTQISPPKYDSGSTHGQTSQEELMRTATMPGQHGP
jgi:hypothetical protein